MAFPRWPAKDPDDVLDYAMDWSNRLEEDETIESALFTIVSGDINIDSQAINGTDVVCWLSGGTDAGISVLRCRITTSGGRQMDQSIQIKTQTK